MDLDVKNLVRLYEQAAKKGDRMAIMGAEAAMLQASGAESALMNLYSQESIALINLKTSQGGK